MVKQTARIAFVLFSLIFLFACSKEKQLEIEVTAKLDGKPTPEAEVQVDGVVLGTTDERGYFSQIIKKEPGKEIGLSVRQEAPGFRIEPWKESFVMKLPPKDVVEKYSFTADLKATKYFTLVVLEKGNPVEDAVIRIKGKKVGKTDEKGELVYDFKRLPKKGVKIAVAKQGYTSWRKTAKVKPGDRLEISLSRRAIITVRALTDEYGRSKGIPGVVVSINNKRKGKTNSKGAFTYVYKGTPGRKVKLALAVPGYIPEEWDTRVKLEGKRTIERYFYPSKPKPIRVGIFGYVNNTPDVDLTDTLSRIEGAVSNNLFSYLSFRKVPGTTLREKMKESKLNIEEITNKGWQKTRLIRTVDMIILGSVVQDERGFTIETKVYSSGGKLILGQINTAKRKKDIKNTAKDIVRNIIDRFPFEGTIVEIVNNERFRINLGKDDHKIRKGMEFALMTPLKEKSGRIKGYRDIGTLTVKNTKRSYSWAEIAELKKDIEVAPGFKVVRRIYTEEERKAAQNTVIISAKGGVPPDVSPLRGVNVYRNDVWVGTTGSNGKTEIPVRIGRNYSIVLYRHGYQQESNRVRIQQDGETWEFILNVNNSLFKVESAPSGATVFIDEEKIGKTPIVDGKLVNFGFHTVRISAGGDYRDWEEVMEFNSKVEDRTGPDKIALYKDYLKIGKRAEESGDIDAALEAYRSPEKDHPDYAVSRNRLAQLYMDEKNDYDSAIQEFENVLSIPANQQLIYKQFAVTYTNLGHAYYEKGNGLIQKDRDEAAQYFAKAIQNLKIAKQNTRFFPTASYDEAIHDTYYYLALSHHKLYLVTRKDAILDKANLAWREYFDFFPKKLESDDTFAQMRDSADKYWTQIKDLM